MMQAMLIVLGVYLAACYAYGMYLVLRLFAGRRLRHTAMGTPPRRVVRPLTALGKPAIAGMSHDVQLDQAKAA